MMRKADACSILWSVVVIARNEEARIHDCLCSIIDAMRGRSHEIILVDSASTDGTPAIAEGLGVGVVRIPGDFPLSPAAGRHVGYLNARGSMLLFMDGDSVLARPWVEAAEGALGDQRVAGVAGLRRLVDINTGAMLCEDQYGGAALTQPSTHDYLGGPAAYRADILREVGGFNPFLRAYEEAELGGRIRKAGYSLLRLPISMTTHYVTSRHETFRDLIRRSRAGYLLGRGQLLRYGMRYACVRSPHTEGLSRLFLFGALEFAFLVGLAAVVAGYGPTVLAIVVFCFAALFILFAFRAGDVRKPLYYFVEWSIAAPLFLKGFLLSPRRPEEYPQVP